MSPVVLSSSGASPMPQLKNRKPGNPDPDAEVIALSPNSLTATPKFICNVCNMKFSRPQNLSMHMRTHKIPAGLPQGSAKNNGKKRAYVCPEPTCVHSHPSRALGDLTAIKKHFYRKHQVKKWACQKCSRRYAFELDWKEHEELCGTKGHKCDCGKTFNRKQSLTTHMEKHWCVLAESSASQSTQPPPPAPPQLHQPITRNMSPFQLQQWPESHHFPSSLPLAPSHLMPTTTTSSFSPNYTTQTEPYNFSMNYTTQPFSLNPPPLAATHLMPPSSPPIVQFQQPLEPNLFPTNYVALSQFFPSQDQWDSIAPSSSFPPAYQPIPNQHQWDSIAPSPYFPPVYQPIPNQLQWDSIAPSPSFPPAYQPIPNQYQWDPIAPLPSFLPAYQPIPENMVSLNHLSSTSTLLLSSAFQHENGL